MKIQNTGGLKKKTFNNKAMMIQEKKPIFSVHAFKKGGKLSKK